MLFGVLKIETMSFPFNMPMMSKERRRRIVTIYPPDTGMKQERGAINICDQSSKQLPNPRISRFFQGKTISR